MSLPERMFAVLDGALFEDLRSEAADFGFEARPLYTNPDTTGVGPHLIAVNDSQALETLYGLVEDKPTGILWYWPGSGDSLWRHLRRNAMMEIPSVAGDTYEAVIFRYADSNVMTWIMNLLDEEQYSRLLGDASCIVVRAAGSSKTQVFRAGIKLKPKPSQFRFIRLSMEQMDQLSRECLERSRLRVMSAIRRGAPDETKDLSDVKLREIVIASEHQGYEIGIRSERAHARWAYLNLLTRGRLIKQPGVLEYMQDSRMRPDRKVDLMLRSISMWANKNASGTS